MRSCENAIGVMTQLQTSLVAEETWVDGATEKLSMLPTATSALELDVSQSQQYTHYTPLRVHLLYTQHQNQPQDHKSLSILLHFLYPLERHFYLNMFAFDSFSKATSCLIISEPIHIYMHHHFPPCVAQTENNLLIAHPLITHHHELQSRCLYSSIPAT